MSVQQSDFLHKAGVKVTVVGAATNILLALLKFTAGYFGRSSALIADAMDSASDLISDVIVMVSLRISSKPRDADHPYGHGRAETLGSIVIGLILITVGVEYILYAVETIRSGVAGSPTGLAVGGAVASICIKEACYRYTIHMGKTLGSQVIIANAHHHRSDELSSVVALAGIIGAMAGYKILDPLAAIGLAFFVIKTGFQIVWGGVQEMMDASAPQEFLREIEEIILNSPEVISFHDLRTRKIGRETLVDVHIQVHPYISVSEGHNIAENVRRELTSSLKNMGEIMVHIDAEDDGPGIHYGFTRRELEEKAREAISRVHSLGKHFDMQVHYLSGKAFLEIYVELPSEMSIREGREIARKIKNDLIALKEVQDVKVRLNLIE